MAIVPTPKPTYPDVPVAPGVPPVLRQAGATQATIVQLASDAISVAQLFLAPQWGIYDLYGNPVLASSSTISQIVASVAGTLGQIGSLFGLSGDASFACSVGGLEFHQDYRISNAPQEQGAFLSYNKVQEPFVGRVTFYVGDSPSQRAGFLATVSALCASLQLYSLVMPEATYPSVNLTHYDFRRTAESGVSLLAVDVWCEQVRVSGTTAFSNVDNGSNVQPISPSQNPNASGQSAVPAAGGLT